jgi:D-3-phosphoglycerate dehydrogenase
MTWRVLVSAPYMLPVVEEFRSRLAAAGVEIVCANVCERLCEAELLAVAGTLDGVICGDNEFTERVLRSASPRLKVISKWGTGIDSIDTARGAIVDVSALIAALDASQRTVNEGDARNGRQARRA